MKTYRFHNVEKIRAETPKGKIPVLSFGNGSACALLPTGQHILLDKAKCPPGVSGKKWRRDLKAKRRELREAKP